MANPRNNPNNPNGNLPLFDQLKKLTAAYESQQPSLAKLTDQYQKMAHVAIQVNNALKAITAISSMTNKPGKGVNLSHVVQGQTNQTNLLKKRHKEERKEYDLRLFILRGISDKIAKMVGATSLFLVPGGPRNWMGLAFASLINTVLDKFLNEIQASNQVTNAAIQRGFNAIDAVNILSRNSASLRFLAAEERSDVVTTAMANLVRNFEQNDPRLNFLMASKLLGQDLKVQTDLMSELLFVTKSDTSKTLGVMLDLREISFNTGLGMDQLVTSMKESLQATKTLYSNLGPRQQQLVSQAMTNIAAIGGKQQDDIKNLLSTLISDGNVAARLGVADLVNRLGGARSQNEASQIFRDILIRLKQTEQNIFRNMDIITANIAGQAISPAFGGMDLRQFSSALDTAIRNFGSAVIKDRGRDIEAASVAVSISQDLSRLLNEQLTPFAADVVAGLKEVILSVRGMEQSINKVGTQLTEIERNRNFQSNRVESRAYDRRD